MINDDGSVENSLLASGVIANLPPIEIGLIFVHPSLKEDAKTKIDKHLRTLLEEKTVGV